MIYLLYLLLGAFAGVLSGLFGIGGGLVIVPVLLTTFKLLNFDPQLTIHMALGTSLATIIVTSMNSMWAHHRKGGVDWKVVLTMAPGIVVAAYLGGFVAHLLDATVLAYCFTGFITLVAIKMWFGLKPKGQQPFPGVVGLSISGIGIGFLSAIFGIGGGTISVPLLSRFGLEMRKAVGISSALGLPIALTGALSYAISGWNAPGLPEMSLGYVYLPAFIGIVLTSSVFSRVGANLAHKLDPRLMQKSFALLLVIIAIKTLLTS
ncbi:MULTISPECIES: sulfite exporter TauE/SafE family protein [Ferrimonas]|uniref:sulfite exporter TauE/SafE family protein n=1 Tax=Ferrimonas TaxID=44011 RepID=UPI00040CBC6C|nr:MULTISPECIES: sulfite exporter TauE/SafE family protein [Ferrimonas]USD37147.1 sulfite exporter TauE/SafE family protein [Ferrimonas sp. SCSIO 43195]